MVMNPLGAIRLALQMSYEQFEKQLDQLTGGSATYPKTQQISEIEAAHLALYTFERKLQHILDTESRR